MADPKSLPSTEGPIPNSGPEVPKPLRRPNPIWKYMGFGENFRPKLPSRNWTIFLSITSALAGAIVYDRREKKRAQRKWCKVVEHLAKEPLGPRELPRRMTVVLEAPPGDGLRVAQEHFKAYVKPILVSSGVDWEFVQGRREGDVRAEIAERIRQIRLPEDQRNAAEDPIAQTRISQGTRESDGPRGILIIGRHAWKEYVRGLHEGWLGPLQAPQVAAGELAEDFALHQIEATEPQALISAEQGEASIDEASLQPEPVLRVEEKPEAAPKKPSEVTPWISTLDYKDAQLPTAIPSELDPSVDISFPHVLGFRNTPLRIYRFLNRRKLADNIGRQTAALILCNYRPYKTSKLTSLTSDTLSPISEFEAEQQAVLETEEEDWPKSVRKREEQEPERTWLEPIVLDPRVAERMRKAELTAQEELRASKIYVPEVEIEGWIKGGLRKLGKKTFLALGFRKEEGDVWGAGTGAD